MADTKTSALTLSSTVLGDADYVEFVDASAADNKRAYGKDITGGMLAHGDAIKAFYHFEYSTTGSVNYRKICTLPTSSGSTGDKVRLLLKLSGTGSAEHSEIEIILGNRTTRTQRILSIKTLETSTIQNGGIRTYIEADGSLSVYIYDNGTDIIGVSVELLSTGALTIATVIAPNDVGSGITTPTGTLSLDTTASPYSDGVPDGNEGWTTLTNAASYTGTCHYRRHANGLVEVQGDYTALGTTSDGTAITTTALPAGYRTSTNTLDAVLTGTITGGVCGRIVVETDGTLKIYNYDTATTPYRFHILYMAEA